MFKYILFVILLLSPLTLRAGESILNKNQQDIRVIESYLQGIKYLSSSFIQEAPDGSFITGKFYLSRPGKMRIEYSKPSNILVVVNGSVLAYQDLELEETSYLRTNSTPASFLTRKKISFSAKDIEVTNFSKDDKLLSVSLVKKNKKEAGEFTLVFNRSPIKFLRMEVKDDSEQLTRVTLGGHDFKTKINNKLFIVKNSQLP
jgi:outer membrane lipoprotein-sorting protein